MAWLIVSVTGAIAGVLFAYIQSPFFFEPQGWQVFEVLVVSPGIYWGLADFPLPGHSPAFLFGAARQVVELA